MVNNLVLQRYVSARPNHVICIDISFLQNPSKQKRCYIVTFDVATRVVVGHYFIHSIQIKGGSLDLADILDFLGHLLKK